MLQKYFSYPEHKNISSAMPWRACACYECESNDVTFDHTPDWLKIKHMKSEHRFEQYECTMAGKPTIPGLQSYFISF